jgi:hypothetical protein
MGRIPTLIQTRRNQYSAITAMALLSFGLFCYYVFYNTHVLYSNAVDAHYYVSIARNLHDGMGFYDGTTIPKAPITTPQNGIVSVELLLMKLGIHEKTSLFAAVAVINYIFLLFSSLLLYKIAGDLEVPTALNLLIIANLLFSGNMFLALVAPLNDGIAFALSVLVLLLCIRNYERASNWLYLAIFAVSVMGAHFRLQSILIPFCAAIASLIVKRYNGFLTYLFIAASSSLFVYIPYAYLIRNGYTFHRSIDYVLSEFRIDKIGELITYIGGGVSELFLRFGAGGGRGLTTHTIPFFIIIAVLVMYYCIEKVLRREFRAMLLSLVILTTIAMYTLLPCFRYIILVMPLLMILLSSTSRWKHILKPVFALYLLYSIGIVLFRIVSIEPYYYDQKRQTELMKPLFKNDASLFSELPSASYFLFDKPSSSDLHLSDGTHGALLFGTDEFVTKGIGRIRSEFPNLTIDDYGRHWMIVGSEYRVVKMSPPEL